MKIALTFHIDDQLRAAVGRILGHKRPATRTELIQAISASVGAEFALAREFDRNRDTDVARDVPGQLGLFVTETKNNAKQEIAS